MLTSSQLRHFRLFSTFISLFILPCYQYLRLYVIEGRIIKELLFEKYFKGSYRVLIEILFRNLPGRTDENN